MSVEDDIRAGLQDMGRTIKSWFPQGWGFILLVTKLGERGTLLYTASVQRADSLQVMREFIAVNMEERNWQQEMPQLEIEEEFTLWWAKQMERMPNYSDNKKVKEMCRDAFLAGRSTA